MDSKPTTEMSERRKHAFELMKHPLNRTYFQDILAMLKEDGVYGWIDMQETFTYQEIQETIHAAIHEELAENAKQNRP